MLDNGCDCFDRKRILGSQSNGNIFLIADAEIALSNSNQRRGCALGRLYNINLQSLSLVHTLIKGNIHTGMIGIRNIVENDSNFVKLIRICLCGFCAVCV